MLGSSGFRSSPLIAAIQTKLRPLFTPRFLKFGVVGASGVVVNLGFLFIFADLIRVQTNVASAMAIELSIISNLLLNDLWTFRDRRPAKPFWRRAVKFHIVSGVGAAGQLAVFVFGNVLWMLVLFSPEQVEAYFATAGGLLERYVGHPLFDPPDVGQLKYVSQLFGIGAAVGWNFLANFYWTWRTPKEAHR